ncbi:MAG: response regulator [Bdellovibrionota bacterium]
MSFSTKILVVDDFEMMRFLIKTGLSQLGYTNIEEADDGDTAVLKLFSCAGTDPYSIVFCDWNMPKVSGLQVLESCRKDSDYKLTPFVMVTAEAEQQNVIKAVKAGANDYIIKPITPDNLRVRLETIMSKFCKKAA